MDQESGDLFCLYSALSGCGLGCKPKKPSPSVMVEFARPDRGAGMAMGNIPKLLKKNYFTKRNFRFDILFLILS